MANIDPITFAVIRHRLFNIVEEAIIALKNVSGTHITNEGHDLMVSLYRADGGLLISGAGFLHHIVPASWAVKHILKEYSEDPGLYEDDVYFLNDPYVAALHAPDAYLVAPIHHKGQLVAFVANFVHVTDIGAIDPGGFCPNATECYQEGFRTRGLKLVERGRMRRDVLETIENIGRVPDLTGLDIRSQIAACNVAKVRMQNLLEEYGADTVDTVCQELIDQSESLLRQRLRELPNGTWRGRQYLDSKGQISRVELAMTKQDDRLIFDFTGSSPQVPFGSNCTYCSTVGGIFAPIFPLLCYDMVWNDGAIKSVEVIAPEGSVVNCRFPAPVSIATVGLLQICNNLSNYCISKMLGSSPAYRNEASAVWAGSHVAVTFFGVNQHDQAFVSILTDSFAGAGGASSFKDGVEVGGEVPNLVSRWANAETHEITTPILYLYRRLIRDAGGPGLYRGGVSHEAAVTLHDRPQVGFLTYAKGMHVPMSYGIMGGYPGCCVDLLLFRETGLWESRRELPYNLGSTRGIVERVDWGCYQLNEGDVFYHRLMGGGGYGDPLDRDPQAVWRDVELGFVSRGSARDIYGVVLDSEGKAVDVEGTRALRERIRSQRLKGSTWRGERYALCPRCDQGTLRQRPLCMKEGSLNNAGPLRSGDERFVLREFFCPDCATLVDVEIALRGDPLLYDELLMG